MKKEYVAPKAMIVDMADDLLQTTTLGSGGEWTANSMSFMDFGGSAGGGRVAFN